MTTRRLFVALFFLALFAMAARETLDPDLWWHLRTGEYILQEGIPRYDVFSFTVVDHRWITHEWLSQVLLWLLYQAAGFPGLILFFAGVITLAFAFVYVRTPGRPYLAAFVVLLAAFASAITWGARPQIFNLLLAAVFVFLVEGVREGKLRPAVFWLLPLLTVLWVNLHSGYLLGVVLLATYVAGEAGRLWWGDRDSVGLEWPAVRLLALVTALSFLAAIINPNGYLLWFYPFETLGSSAMQTHIQEWQPPDFHHPMFWPFAAMLAFGVLGWVYRSERPALTDVLLFLGTGAAGLLSARHIPLFAVVSAPIVARSWAELLARTRLRPLLAPSTVRPSRPLRLANLVLLLLGLLAAGVWVVGKIAGNEEEIAAHYPVHAVDFLEQEGLAQQRGYNTYDWGGYLIWRQVPVFVDGRADVYGDEFLFYYLQTLEVQQEWREPLEAFGVDYLLLREGSALTNLLQVSGEWQEAYADELAQVFVRSGR